MKKMKSTGKEKSKMDKVSDSTIRRLSFYHRTLKRMEKQNIKLIFNSCKKQTLQ